MNWKKIHAPVLAALVLTACSGEKEEEEAAHVEEDAVSTQEQASPTVHSRNKYERPRFDYRVLARSGQEGVSFQTKWMGSMGLARSRFGGMKISVTFDLIEDGHDREFKGGAALHQGLSDCIKDVFRMKRSSELHGAASLEQCREELIAAVNGFYGYTLVREAYFQEFRPGGGTSVW